MPATKKVQKKSKQPQGLRMLQVPAMLATIALEESDPEHALHVLRVGRAMELIQEGKAAVKAAGDILLSAKEGAR